MIDLENLMKNYFTVEHWRSDKLLSVDKLPNAITDEGKIFLLDVMFEDTAKSATWYIGLIDNAGYTQLAAADTLAVQAGWSEFTDYAAHPTRQTWDNDAAADGAITNTTTADFTIDANGSEIKGVFCTNDVDSNTGKLWATAIWATAKEVESGDIFKVKYTVTF